ncbi:hypothetical protein MBLNU459_g0538t1 [Dothideomycetes sp. NU459]
MAPLPPTPPSTVHKPTKNKNNTLASKVEKRSSKISGARVSLPGVELYRRLVADGTLKDPKQPALVRDPHPRPQPPPPESGHAYLPRAEPGYRRLWNEHSAALRDLVTSTPSITTMSEIKARRTAATTYPSTCSDGIVLDSPNSVTFPTTIIGNGLYE